LQADNKDCEFFDCKARDGSPNDLPVSSGTSGSLYWPQIHTSLLTIICEQCMFPMDATK